MAADKANRPDEERSHWLQDLVTNFCRRSPDNSLRSADHEPAWDDPLIGFSSGGDPLYAQLKEDIGLFFWTPLEAFKQSFPLATASPDDLTVISWVIPQTRATKRDHRKETVYPSERWIRSRLFGERFNAKLRKHVVDSLLEAGFEAVAPVDSPVWSRQTSLRYGFASNWSERHAAHASGLGTFGLCDGLITPVGKAIRCGSVVCRMALEPTIRPYPNHRAYCLYFSHGKCGKCIKRCPVGAISERGHDKTKCRDYIRNVTAKYGSHRFGLETNACGLCQTRVPCESRIPLAQ